MVIKLQITVVLLNSSSTSKQHIHHQPHAKTIHMGRGAYESQTYPGERGGVVVVHWTPNQGVLGLIPTGGTELCP